MEQISIRLVKINGITEVSIDMADFEFGNVSITNDMENLKHSYDNLISDVKTAFASKLTSSVRWQIGKKLVDFMDHNMFNIMNFTSACAKDLDMSKSIVSSVMSFSRVFTEKEIDDSIPYSTYRSLISKKKRGKVSSC